MRNKKGGKKSDFELFVSLVAKMPWWVNLLLAVISYAILHQYAAMPIPKAVNVAQMGDATFKALWKAMAIFGQVVVPAAFVLGAIVSLTRQLQPG